MRLVLTHRGPLGVAALQLPQPRVPRGAQQLHGLRRRLASIGAHLHARYMRVCVL